MSTSVSHHSNWGILLASCILAATLALATTPSVPSLAAMRSDFGSDCQAGPDSSCCTCGEYEGEYYCHPNADTGGVVCRDDGYCPIK